MQQTNGRAKSVYRDCDSLQRPANCLGLSRLSSCHLLSFIRGSVIDSFLNVCRKGLALLQAMAFFHELQTIFFKLKLLNLSTGRFRVVFNPENIFRNYILFVSKLKFALR